MNLVVDWSNNSIHNWPLVKNAFRSFWSFRTESAALANKRLRDNSVSGKMLVHKLCVFMNAPSVNRNHGVVAKHVPNYIPHVAQPQLAGVSLKSKHKLFKRAAILHRNYAKLFARVCGNLLFRV